MRVTVTVNLDAVRVAEPGLGDAAHVGVHVGENEKPARAEQGCGGTEKAMEGDMLEHQGGGNQIRFVREAALMVVVDAGPLG